MSDVVDLDAGDLSAVATRASGVLRSNGLVVAPAGSMYGLYANVVAEDATARVFAARQAPRTSPLPVVVHNPRQLPNLVADLTEEAERLVGAYWPGPLTLVFRMAPQLSWHLGESDGFVALRMPPEPVALMLASKVGPLACAAAAHAGAPPPLTAQAARDSLGDAVDLYLQDGSRDGEVSTIVDVSRGGAHVLREGAIPAHHIAQVAGGEVEPGRRPGDPAVDARNDVADGAAEDPPG